MNNIFVVIDSCMLTGMTKTPQLLQETHGNGRQVCRTHESWGRKQMLWESSGYGRKIMVQY